jgi:hypothetical protein
MIGDQIWMEVDFSELIHQHEQQIVLGQTCYDFLYGEVFNDVPDILAESVDVVAKVALDIAGVLGQSVKIEVRGVVKPQASSGLKADRRGIRQFVLESLIGFDDVVFLPVQNAVQSPQNDKRKNYVPIFVLFENASQNVISDLPDEVDLVLKVVHRFRCSLETAGKIYTHKTKNPAFSLKTG